MGEVEPPYRGFAHGVGDVAGHFGHDRSVAGQLGGVFGELHQGGQFDGDVDDAFAGGWVQGVETAGLGPSEGYEIEGNGRKLYFRVQPRPGAPREVSFTVRPQGAPVWIEGTRDGRPLKPAEVSIAEEGLHPDALPAKLPDIEPQGDTEKERPDENVLAPPPADRPGVHLWVVLSPGRKVMDLDKETRERLKALGYLGK